MFQSTRFPNIRLRPQSIERTKNKYAFADNHVQNAFVMYFADENVCMNENEDRNKVKLQGVKLTKVTEFEYILINCAKPFRTWSREREKESELSAANGDELQVLKAIESYLPKLEENSIRLWLHQQCCMGYKQAKMKVAELKMVRFSVRFTRMNKIKNEYVRGIARVSEIKDSVKKAKLIWFGQILRSESKHVGKGW